MVNFECVAKSRMRPSPTMHSSKILLLKSPWSCKEKKKNHYTIGCLHLVKNLA